MKKYRYVVMSLSKTTCFTDIHLLVLYAPCKQYALKPSSMSFPPPLSCMLHPYIPMPEHCMTCSQIVINLGIVETQAPHSTFSGSYNTPDAVQQHQPTYNPSAQFVNTTTNYPQISFVPYPHNDSYSEQFALEKHESLTVEEKDDDDYPDRFVLEEHERLVTDADDDYPDRFALDEHERIVRNEDNDYPDRFALDEHERTVTDEDDDYRDRFALEEHERIVTDEDGGYPNKFALGYPKGASA